MKNPTRVTRGSVLAWSGGEEFTLMQAAIVDRIRGEFIEMPGLQLTTAQAAKLWGMDVPACEHVIDVLVAASFLRWTPSGKIARAEHA